MLGEIIKEIMGVIIESLCAKIWQLLLQRWPQLARYKHHVAAIFITLCIALIAALVLYLD